MAKKRKHPRLPNGYGSIKRLSGKNRTNPYGVYPPTKEFDINGIPVPQKAICYVDDWYKGFTVLTWYKNGDYYPGREKELSSERDELNKQVLGILAKYNQNEREAAAQVTYKEVFEEYYLWKFKQPYGHKGKKTQMEYSMRSGFKNSSPLHDKPFQSLTTADLQNVLNDCKLKHASLELVLVLYRQLYAYAISHDLADKDYSQYVKIERPDDDEKGEPFTSEDLDLFWENSNDEIIEMILIMCYSGFRVSAYETLETNLKEIYFQGGVKTKAGRNRQVPIHSSIIPLVKKRMERQHGKYYIATSVEFRRDMKIKLAELGVKYHTPHDCRHTFSALCEKYGVKENDRKRMLGHTFQDVTNKTYGHRELKDLRIEIEKIKVCH